MDNMSEGFTMAELFERRAVPMTQRLVRETAKRLRELGYTRARTHKGWVWMKPSLVPVAEIVNRITEGL